MHPFAEAMADFLKESGARALRPSITKPFMRTANAKYEEDIKRLSKYVDDSKSGSQRITSKHLSLHPQQSSRIGRLALQTSRMSLISC